MTGTSKFDPAELAKLPAEYLQEDIGHRLLIVASVFIVLQPIFVCLFYVSRHLNKTLDGLECWLFIPMGYMGWCWPSLEAFMLQDPHMLITRSKIVKAVEFIDYEAITRSKLTILSLYLRIFSTRPYQIAAYLIATLIILTAIGAHISSLSICPPIAYQWDPTIPGGHCGNIMLAYQMVCVPNIATDIMMLLLPLPAVFKLRIGLAAKIGLLITFLTGSVGIVTSILRLDTFIHSAELLKDPTYKCIPTFTFVITEGGTYMIAACMPTLRPLKRRLLPNHSVTKLIDLTLSAFSVRTASNFSRRLPHQGGDLRTTPIKLDTSSKASDDLEFQSFSTTRLNDVGHLATTGHVSNVSSIASHEL
ncbi:hypothetical protein P171DRAFT_491208 [Karstenula rhodostoma CBS 690.94]|uniref:Rhodopsin domain-containing protein n=1 Tax=Karstenula rhodostoma CBS 690.94 TaxID=1392251 RepID=A0A9P4U5Y1_9PLEO|nr:hypothetical protein P171DRAFT_491208 [Karstenula rhodostoma CBS 690.94]